MATRSSEVTFPIFAVRQLFEYRGFNSLNYQFYWSYNCNRLTFFLIMLNFGNFDLRYANSNAFWGIFGILDIVPVLACLCRNT